MGKAWHSIKTQNQKAKENLQTKANQNQKTKTTRLSPVKRFLYIHIARLNTL
jgi:hypothetical protein